MGNFTIMIFGILHSWSFRINLASVVKIVMTTSVEVLFYITGFIALKLSVLCPATESAGNYVIPSDFLFNTKTVICMQKLLNYTCGQCFNDMTLCTDVQRTLTFSSLKA